VYAQAIEIMTLFQNRGAKLFNSGEQATRLQVIAKAPPGARWVGFGLRVLNQINDDFAEFSGASLRRAPQLR